MNKEEARKIKIEKEGETRKDGRAKGRRRRKRTKEMAKRREK